MLLNTLIPLSIIKICLNIVIYKFFRKKKRLRLVILFVFIGFTINLLLFKYFLYNISPIESNDISFNHVKLLRHKKGIDKLLNLFLQGSSEIHLPPSLLNSHLNVPDHSSIYFLKFSPSDEKVYRPNGTPQAISERKTMIDNFYIHYITRPLEGNQGNHFLQRIIAYQMELFKAIKEASLKNERMKLSIRTKFNYIPTKISKVFKRYKKISLQEDLLNATEVQELLSSHTSKLMEEYKNLRDAYINVLSKNLSDSFLPSTLRGKADQWVSQDHINPDFSPEIGKILNAMSHSPYNRADTIRKGTQLKVQLILESGSVLIMKPQRYDRDQEFPDYQGADRHNGEIASFHVNRILGLNRAPLTTGRFINLTELQSKSSITLAETFHVDSAGRRCFYGVCMYCKKADSVCVKEGDLLESSVSLLLPDSVSLQKVVNPWIRSYRPGHLSWWEHEPSFCSIVRVSRHETNAFSSTDLLLYLIDAAIFDFLTGNSDRHHVELLHLRQQPTNAKTTPFVTLLDNGKSFGTHSTDELSILAPLYGCCIIAEPTWRRLLLLATARYALPARDNETQSGPPSSAYTLSELLKQALALDALPNLLLEQYYPALERRLNIVLATVYHCLTHDIDDNKIDSLTDRYKSVVVKRQI